MSREELHSIVEDRKYWEDFGLLLGWRLHGWTGRSGATFITTCPVEPHYRHTIEIIGYQRDSIMKAFEEQSAIVRKLVELDDPGLRRVTKGNKAMALVRDMKKKGAA